jgi:ubiquinone/menaquinone biosynthesis C-methylase UbiE
VGGVGERKAGFAGGGARYAASRPGYPRSVIEEVIEQLGLHPGDLVVDVGAGTGQCTALLLAAGIRVVAVEPVDDLRDTLRAGNPGAEVRVGTAEDLPLDDGSVHGYVAAQAFHWFDVPAALAAFDRVVRPGGRAALLFNRRDTAPSWMAAWDDLVERIATGPRAASSDWRAAVAASQLVEIVHTSSTPNPHHQRRDDLIRRFRSSSAIAAQPEARQAELVRSFEAVIDTDPATAGDEVIAVPYLTDVTILARREPSARPTPRS